MRLLILDEPTAALNEHDSENLLQLMLEFKKQGIACILISHKLNEVSKVSDSVTILRDGKTIETLDMKKDKVTEDRIISGMVGRDLTSRYPERHASIGEVILEVKDWTVYHEHHADRKVLDQMSALNIRQGRGCRHCWSDGSWAHGACDELVRRVLWPEYWARCSRTVSPFRTNSVNERPFSQRLAYVTEDRKHYGLVLMDDIKRNISLTGLAKLTKNAAW